MFALEFVVFLLPGTYNATQVDLPPFFSDDVSGTGVVQNFLDGGAALMVANMAANGTSLN
jgi:hypothetical protein